MSDSDDWMNDDDVDANDKKPADDKFKNEDTKVVDKKQEEAELKEKKRLEQEEANKNARTKKNAAVDYDKKFAEKQKRLGGGGIDTSKLNTEGLTEAQKGHQYQIAQETNQVNDLLGGDDDEADSGAVQKKVYLNSEEDYRNYGKNTADILYKGPTPYRVEVFYKEMFKDLGNHCDAKQMKKILDDLQTKYNEKNKEGKSKKKDKKPFVNLGHGGINKEKNQYEFNNNPAMINDVMGEGQNDEYGDYGDYGDEGYTGKEKEKELDFM